MRVCVYVHAYMVYIPFLNLFGRALSTGSYSPMRCLDGTPSFSAASFSSPLVKGRVGKGEVGFSCGLGCVGGSENG